MDIVQTPMVAPGYYAAMGFDIPAGLGVQATTGERPLILVGDGAFQMTGWELGNCRRYAWDRVVIVFNNASWEMLRTFQPETRDNDLDEWNFAAIAEAPGRAWPAGPEPPGIKGCAGGGGRRARPIPAHRGDAGLRRHFARVGA